MEILDKLRKIKKNNNLEKIKDVVEIMIDYFKILQPGIKFTADKIDMSLANFIVYTSDGYDIMIPSIEKEVYTMSGAEDFSELYGNYGKYKGELKPQIVDFWEHFIELLQRDKIDEIKIINCFCNQLGKDNKDTYDRSIVLTEENEIQEFKRLFLDKIEKVKIDEDYFEKEKYLG